MSAHEIDDYLAELDEPKRSTLRELRATILRIVPEAEEGIAYGMPVFRVNGKAIAGFAAFGHHLSYFPHSGSVVSDLAADLAPYPTSKGTLRFGVDTSLPGDLVEKLITARRAEIV